MGSRIPQSAIGIAAVVLAVALIAAGVCTAAGIFGDDEPFLENPIEPLLDLTPTATATPEPTPRASWTFDPDTLDRTTPHGALNSYLRRAVIFDYRHIVGNRERQTFREDHRIGVIRDHMRGAALSAALEGAMTDQPEARPLLGTRGTVLYQRFRLHSREELNTVGPRTLFRLDIEIERQLADGRGAVIPTVQRGVVDIVLERSADDGIYRITAWVWREMGEPRRPDWFSP